MKRIYKTNQVLEKTGKKLDELIMFLNSGKYDKHSVRLVKSNTYLFTDDFIDALLESKLINIKIIKSSELDETDFINIDMFVSDITKIDKINSSSVVNILKGFTNGIYDESVISFEDAVIYELEDKVDKDKYIEKTLFYKLFKQNNLEWIINHAE